MHLLHVILLLCYALGTNHGSLVHDYSNDMLPLLDFKRAVTDDPYGVLASWNTSTHFCTWPGVTCSRRHPGRVTSLQLPGQNMEGEIAPSIGNLTFLRSLDLSMNGFSGRMPPLGRLWRLEVLNLSFNSLRDAIPHALTNCSELRMLNLGWNRPVGEIYPELGLLSKLLQLDLPRSKLTGTIPSALSNLTHLERINLDANNLSGSIPAELGKLSNLSILALGFNRLSGGIPQSLFNLSSLYYFDLVSNSLEGALPPNMGETLPNLRAIGLARNMFHGHIPSSLGNSSGLEVIVLTRNNFSGKVPNSISRLPRLTRLFLGGNLIESSNCDFLYVLINCTLLEALDLSLNQLEGFIPDQIGNLSANLQWLYLGGSHLSGKVPLTIGNLRNLTVASEQRSYRWNSRVAWRVDQPSVPVPQ